jgi:hypothetical protein
VNELAWSCEAQPLNKQEPVLNVGSKFTVNCKGPSVTWPANNFELVLTDKQKYFLKIMKIEKQESDQVQFVAVSYRTGEHRDQSFALQSAETLVPVEGFHLNVASVLQPQGGEPLKPFPPFGFVGLSYPLWLWISLVGAILLVLGTAVGTWWAHSRKQQWVRQAIDSSLMSTTLLVTLPEYLREFTRMNSSSFINELFRQIRRMQRMYHFSQASSQDPVEAKTRNEALNILNHIFKLFLTRELSLPIHVWPNKKAIRSIKKLPKMQGIEGEIHLALAELQRALENPQAVRPDEFHQLTRLVQVTSQKVHTAQNEGKK